MSNTKSIAKSNVAMDTEEDGAAGSTTIRPNIEWPKEIWKKVKIAAIEADAESPAKFVIDTMAEKVGAKAA